MKKTIVSVLHSWVVLLNQLKKMCILLPKSTRLKCRKRVTSQMFAKKKEIVGPGLEHFHVTTAPRLVVSGTKKIKFHINVQIGNSCFHLYGKLSKEIEINFSFFKESTRETNTSRSIIHITLDNTCVLNVRRHSSQDIPCISTN